MAREHDRPDDQASAGYGDDRRGKRPRGLDGAAARANPEGDTGDDAYGGGGRPESAADADPRDEPETPAKR